MADHRVALLAALTAALLGLGLGWVLWGSPHPLPSVVEAPAPEQRLDGGAVALERGEFGKVADPPQMPKELPRGAEAVERIVRVTVQPKPPASMPGIDAPVAPCPPVRVDLALVRLKDQTRRVVASSPDGEVLGGVDIPIEPRPTARDPPANAIGFSFRLPSRAPGLFYDRDIGFARLGIEGSYTPPRATLPAFIDLSLRAGIRF